MLWNVSSNLLCFQNYVSAQSLTLSVRSVSGSLKKTINSKRYGVSLIRFTHHHDCIIAASKNGSWDGERLPPFPFVPHLVSSSFRVDSLSFAARQSFPSLLQGTSRPVRLFSRGGGGGGRELATD